MSSGERPIGAAKGKQSDTEALCQTPPPPSRSRARTADIIPDILHFSQRFCEGAGRLLWRWITGSG